MTTGIWYASRRALGLVWVLASLQAAFAAPTLTLASGVAARGSTVSLPLWYTSTGVQTSGLMWTFSFSPNDFSSVSVTPAAAATASGKSITCNAASAGQFVCLASGMNANTIVDGALASANFTIAGSTASTSSAIQVTRTAAASPAGDFVSTTGLAGTVAITVPTVSLSALFCNPASLTSPGQTQCTVTLSGVASVGGFGVSLGSIAPAATVSMPTSITVPFGAASAQFTAQVSNATSLTSIQVTATANSITKTFNIDVSPPAGSQVVAMPTFAPPPGAYGTANSVTISTTTPGASIRYTVDGSTPSQTVGTLYTGPVTVSTSLMLKAMAYKSGMADSTVASGVYTIGGGGGGGGGGLSVLWGGNSDGNATLDSAFALTSWRVEARFHNIVARSPQEAQDNQHAWELTDSAVEIAVYVTANAQALILAHGGNYCAASIGGITDVYWRVQYKDTTISYQVWNTATGQAVTSVNCSKWSGAMNLAGIMRLGGTNSNTENYKGAMAFLRFYNSAAPNFSARPPDNAPGGEMIKYEFETAADLGSDTSGNARTLRLHGTPSSVSTPSP